MIYSNYDYGKGYRDGFKAAEDKITSVEAELSMWRNLVDHLRDEVAAHELTQSRVKVYCEANLDPRERLKASSETYLKAVLSLIKEGK